MPKSVMPDNTEIGYSSIVDAICTDRHSVVCIDDGGAGFHQLHPGVLVQNFELIVAVRCTAANYIQLTRNHEAWLGEVKSRIGTVAELHVTEIVSPPTSSPWAGVDMGVRLNLLSNAATTLLPHVDAILHAYIGGEQFDEIIGHARAISQDDLRSDATHHHYNKNKTGLERVFYKILAKKISDWGGMHVILQDEGRVRGESVERLFRAGSNIWQSSVIHLPSSAVAGIQVADLICWSINREYVTKSRVLEGKSPSPFCEIANNVRCLVDEKLINAWDAPEQ